MMTYQQILFPSSLTSSLPPSLTKTTRTTDCDCNTKSKSKSLNTQWKLMKRQVKIGSTSENSNTTTDSSSPSLLSLSKTKKNLSVTRSLPISIAKIARNATPVEDCTATRNHKHDVFAYDSFDYNPFADEHLMKNANSNKNKYPNKTKTNTNRTHTATPRTIATPLTSSLRTKTTKRNTPTCIKNTPKAVKFCNQVTIYKIKSYRDFTKQELSRMYTSNEEIKRVSKINLYEYYADGCDWQQAAEEDVMVMDDNGIYIHPVHVFGLEACLDYQHRQQQLQQRKKESESTNQTNNNAPCVMLPQIMIPAPATTLTHQQTVVG